jgi:hypothetical protein
MTYFSRFFFALTPAKNAGTGEAVMNKFTIIGASVPRRAGCVAVISGALLGAVAITGPAQSADFYYPYEYSGYRPAPGYYPYNRCGWYPCQRRVSVGVAERHWVERNYWERRYPVASGPWPLDPPYGPVAGTYPYYQGGYQGGYWDGYPRYSGGSRPRLGFGGVQYQPAPITWEGGVAPQPLYEYENVPRPAWQYDAGPRPPVGIPSPYYNAGFVE